MATIDYTHPDRPTSPQAATRQFEVLHEAAALGREQGRREARRRTVVVATAAALLSGLGSVAVADAIDGMDYRTEAHCSVFVNETDPQQYAMACVPLTSDGDAALDTTWEDGSALYADGRVFDPEDMRFRDSAR